MNVIEVPRGEHSPLGPSSSKKWINCSGSLRASLDVKEDPSEYAAEGTCAHYLSELARKENKLCADWLGWTFKADGFSFEVDEEMAASAQEFVDICENGEGQALVEQRIDFSKYLPAAVIETYGPAFGTLDDCRLVDGVVSITDFKHGKGVQEFAAENPQLLLQALGVYEAYGWLYDIKGFNLAISQPRLGHYDEWHTSTVDLLQWAENLKVWGQKVLEGTEFRAGDWCKFCKVRKTCKTRAAHVTGLILAEGEFEDLDNLEIHALRGMSRWQHLTNDDVAKILPSLGVFESWIKDMKHRALVALVNKETVGDYKLVAGKSSRKWKDDQLAKMKLHSLGVDPFKPQQVISVSVAEKELGKKEFGRRFKLEEDFVKPPGKPTLAPGADKRPAIEVTEVNDFTNLDDAE